MKITRKILTILNLLIVITLLNANVNAEEKQDKYIDLLKNGALDRPKIASSANFYDGSANEYTLKSFEGKFVILNFWASWCLECKENLITLDKLAKKLTINKIDDVVIIPMSLDFKSIEKLKDMYQEYNIKNIDLFFDPNKEMMLDMDVHSPPKSFFIDKSGIAVYTFNQIINWNNQKLYNFIMQIKDVPATGVELPPENDEIIYNKDSTQKKAPKKVTILK